MGEIADDHVPMSDAEIAESRHALDPRLVARIEADAAKIAKLREIIAEIVVSRGMEWDLNSAIDEAAGLIGLEDVEWKIAGGAVPPPGDNKQAPIFGVAVRHEGVLWQLPAPARHGHVLKAIFDATGKPVPGGSEQGFVNIRGEFVSRAEAFALTGKGRNGLTYSEDLWETPEEAQRRAVAPVDPNVEAAAQVLTKWLGYAWDGLDERDISAEFPDWTRDRRLQGNRPALRKIVRRILDAAGTSTPTHRHVKRGSLYRVIGEAEAQVSINTCISAHGMRVEIPRPIKDGSRLTIYQGEDGKLWARFSDEFNDGRFEPVVSHEPASGDRQAALSGTGERQQVPRKRISNPIIDEMPWCSTDE